MIVSSTDPDGRYRIGGLRAGTYRVAETQPPGYDGPDRVGSAGGTLDPPDAVAGIDLAAGTDATGYDFTERRAAPTAGPDRGAAP